jgi:hypothetical protein
MPFFLQKCAFEARRTYKNVDLYRIYIYNNTDRFQHDSVLSQRLYSAKQAMLSAIHAPWLLEKQRRAVGSVRSQSCSVLRSQS